MDALLLAAFASRFIKKTALVAELGSGCGASLFALALTHAHISGVGYERESGLVTAAAQNAVALDLSDRLDFVAADIATLSPACFNKFNLVLANPPWRKGRLPAARLKRRALAMQPDTLDLFCACASKLLHNRGLFCIILQPSLLCELMRAIQPLQLGLRQILPVSSFEDQPAKRALCLLQKNAASDPVLLPGLTLLERASSGVTWTVRARNFCPWACAK